MAKDAYLITDRPLKALTIFAMPMILGSFFQQVYNMADSIIVGRFVGSSALAAVGACAALTNVFICVALGAGVGAGVLVSRYFGAKEYGKMKTVVSTSLLSFLVLSLLLSVFGFSFSYVMMKALQTPSDILRTSVLYLRVYFIGFPFLFMYNILSTMFTSVGESKIPLGLLIFSSILNIFLDLWMVRTLGLGVFGAALATLIAQGVSAVLSLLLFFYRIKRYQSSFQCFDTKELSSMLRIAVPSVLQQSTVSVGMMIVQSVVNPFGTQALAGYSATMRVENVFSLIFVSIGNAVSPFVSQNLGAKKMHRIKEGYHAALPHRKHGEPCDSPIRCLIFSTSFRHFLCLDCRAGRLVCQFPAFLLRAEESLSRGVRLIRSLVQFIYRQDVNLYKKLMNFSVHWFI